MKIHIGRIGLAALVAFGIFALIQPEYMPRAEAPFDKMLHFGLFALATLFAILGTNDYRIAFSLAGLILIAGLSIEIIQSFLPGRSADMMDAAANGLGALAVLGPYFFMKRENSDTTGDTIRQQIIDIYNHERAAGETQAKSLEIAAETYRLAEPSLQEHEIRLNVARIIEEHIAK